MTGGGKRKLETYALNALGVFLLILVPLIGPLPGPGGIPLLLAGLSLLSINNPWAKNLKEFIEKKGLDLSDLIFLDNKKCQLAWDVFIILSLALGISAFFVFDLSWIWQILLSTTLSTLALGWFRNRHRWQRLLKYLKLAPRGRQELLRQELQNGSTTDSLKALTLHQPWASLIAGSHKMTETRSWRPPENLIGQRIAIHAGKLQREPDGYLATAVATCLGSAWRQNLPSGAVIATARIKSVKRIENERDVPAGNEALFGDYTPGRWAWHLTDIRVLPKPIPARGYQKLWHWEYPAGIRRQL